jgi:hypothetical protein
MQSRFFALIGGVLSLLGCPDKNAPMRTKAGKLTQPQVDAIAKKCGASPGMVVIEEGELLIYPAKDFSITSCILDELKATGEFRSPVGNAYHAPLKH